MWKVVNMPTKLPQCPNIIDLGGPQWTRFSVEGNDTFLKFQKKADSLVTKKLLMEEGKRIFSN